MKTRTKYNALSIALAMLITSFALPLFAIQTEIANRMNPFDPDRLTGVPAVPSVLSLSDGEVKWQAFRYGKTGSVALALGTPISLAKAPATEAELKEAALDFVESLQDEFDFAYKNMEVAQILHGKDAATVYITFKESGYPILGAFAAVGYNNRLQIVSVKGRGFGTRFSGSFDLSVDELIKTFCEQSEFAGISPISHRYIWFPVLSDEELFLKASYEVTFTHEDPARRPVVVFDAGSGEVISADNRVFFENLPGNTSGLYRPFRPADQPVTGPFPDEIVRLNGNIQTYSDASGNFGFDVNPDAGPFRITSELKGRWVDVEYEDGADAAFSRQIARIEPVAVEWNRNNSRDDERMLFYHTNLIHSYWKALDPNFRGMDRVIPATCEYGDNYDNAFWNGQGMYFGNGPNLGNLALKGDVIHHEFGHGVTGSIYPWNVLPYEGESGALNEAWSDYFPCSISNEPYMGESAPGGAGAMRNLNNNLVYPDDWFGEVHYDSRLISAAMWHTRAVLGREIADEIFHFARYRLGNNFLSYFTDVLITDDNDGDLTNGTPNYVVLYEQFGRHGIGPGIFPKIGFTRLEISDTPGQNNEGDGDKIWEPGETVRIDFAVKRGGTLYPPPAENVTVRLSCNHPSIVVTRSEIQLGAMSVGDSLTSEQPLLFTIDPEARLSFANFFLTIVADGFDPIQIDTIRLPIGMPKLLVVQDNDDTDDRMNWYRKSLDRLEMVYSEYSVSKPHVSLDDWFDKFENVIWFTGDARTGFLSITNRSRIERYLETGKNIALSGQSIGRELAGTGFLEDNFGTRVVVDSVSQYLINGVENDPVGNGLNLLILGSLGANNQRRPAAIEAMGNGVECFFWPRLDGEPAAGVRMEHENSGAKSIFLSFGIEAIGGHGQTTTFEEFLTSIFNWFELEQAVHSEGASPLIFTVGEAYPNPFNSMVTIAYSVPASGALNYTVIDLTGREITGGVAAAHRGDNLLSLNAANWGSGYYFLKVETSGSVTTRRLLLIR